ncbi:Serine/threonine-protein kinase 16 [Gracilariopsis chorda]|uniref:Serine/threonine-protein kinase 16 n=1 Tax=Gracilariopsis chorda TaxID=448386 RepID=A0A2V3J0C5_9FLOR|nr:Serine/threonine-protein kinase 16 [Gracilariopsis chorda]|eukprot:PXF47799.1 Serine/threonine-protein kinase 16 [Gracilariopsis chorda]
MNVIQKAELFLFADNGPEFKHTSVVCEDGDDYFVAFMKCRLRKVPNQLMKSSDLKGFQLSSEDVFPCIDDVALTKAQCLLSGACYVKIPSLLDCQPKKENHVNKLLLQEARILEKLKGYQHPNLVAYHGYIERNRQLRGLCLEMCFETLYERLRRLGTQFDIDNCFKGIQRGLEFIHCLGYAHNDINPANIMFRKDSTPVIIDFDSCTLIGQELGEKGGTMMFSDENATHSSADNDWYSFRLLRNFIDDQMK